MANEAVWAVPLALGSAASFGVANVAQMRAARRTESKDGIDPGLLVRLIRDPLWIAGLATSVLGYLLQATALFLAPVVLVQPLIVTELLFALPLAAAITGVRLHVREWIGAGLVAIGLAAFEVVAHPTGQRTYAPPASWTAMTLGVALAVLMLLYISAAYRHRPRVRAGALAAAAGTCFGLMSVDTKVVGKQFANEQFGALLHVQPYLLAVSALTGLLLAQTAFRIAPLSVSLPLIDVGEPAVASLLAVLAFNEHLGNGTWTAVGIGLGGAGVILGIRLLASSPLVQHAGPAADIDAAAAVGDGPEPIWAR